MEYQFEGVKILHEFGIKIQSQKINRKYFESYQSNQLRQCLLWSWWAFQVILKLAHKHQLWSPGNLPSLRGQHNRACACKKHLLNPNFSWYLKGRCNLIFFDVLTWDVSNYPGAWKSYLAVHNLFRSSCWMAKSKSEPPKSLLISLTVEVWYSNPISAL